MFEHLQLQGGGALGHFFLHLTVAQKVMQDRGQVAGRRPHQALLSGQGFSPGRAGQGEDAQEALLHGDRHQVAAGLFRKRHSLFGQPAPGVHPERHTPLGRLLEAETLHQEEGLLPFFHQKQGSQVRPEIPGQPVHKDGRLLLQVQRAAQGDGQPKKPLQFVARRGLFHLSPRFNPGRVLLQAARPPAALPFR